MNRLIEFTSNNVLLCSAFFVVLGMLLYTEYTRLFSGLKALSPFAATKLLNDGEAVFIDVRDEKEFKSGHVLNARHVPLSTLDKYLHELEKHKDKDLVVYCDTGARAQRAGSRLRKNGFSRLHTIAGGLNEWEKANLPTVTR